MGKGDKRSRKGKIWRGSHGNTRPRKKGTKPAFVPKPKTKRVVAPVEASMETIGEPAEMVQAEIKAAKPKKPAVPKKPKVEGEKKAPAKKKASTEKKKEE